MGLESFFVSKGLMTSGSLWEEGGGSSSDLGQRLLLWTSLTCGNNMAYRHAIWSTEGDHSAMRPNPTSGKAPSEMLCLHLRVKRGEIVRSTINCPVSAPAPENISKAAPEMEREERKNRERVATRQHSDLQSLLNLCGQRQDRA